MSRKSSTNPSSSGDGQRSRRRPQIVVAELRRLKVEDVDDSTLSRALYSTDASLYRVVPQVVVRPRSVDEVLATIDACRTTGTPLTSRGAGTSIAGNAVGTGVVLDFSRAPQPGPRDRRRSTHCAGRSGHGARRAAARGDSEGSALRPGSVDSHRDARSAA